MPDRRRHRGPHSADLEAFAPERLPALRAATADLSWLLGRGYSETAAVKLVGDRHGLVVRQRAAVQRCACSDDARRRRGERRLSLDPGALRGRDVALDGFNCLVTIEAALSGGVVLAARDGAHRDVSSVHGSYRKVSETVQAVRLAAAVLAAAAPSSVTWCLDRPVGNSGRLRALLLSEAEALGLAWRAELLDGQDKALASRGGVVATSDGWILDRCEAWIDVPGAVIERDVPSAWVVDLAP